MNNHELPVSDSVWTSIQQKQAKKPFIYYVSRVSAACLLLFLGYFTFSHYSYVHEDFDAIVIDEKQISPIEFNHNHPELTQAFAELPKTPVVESITKPTENKIEKTDTKSVLPQEREEEVIVLTIKKRPFKRQHKQYIASNVEPQPKTHVDSEVLLAQIEEKLNIKEKKELESYLTDIKKLASKNSINNKIQTAQNWITKTASDFGIKNKKHKNND